MEQSTIRRQLAEKDHQLTQGALVVTLLNPVSNRTFFAHVLEDTGRGGVEVDFKDYRSHIVHDNRVDMMISLVSTVTIMLFPGSAISGLLTLGSLGRREFQ
jgi:hypothetical protein